MGEFMTQPIIPLGFGLAMLVAVIMVDVVRRVDHWRLERRIEQLEAKNPPTCECDGFKLKMWAYDEFPTKSRQEFLEARVKALEAPLWKQVARRLLHKLAK